MSNINSEYKQNFLSGEEVDFKEFLKLIYRNKLLISVSGIIFFIFACIYALTQKRIWEGNFEIVLEDSNQSITSKLIGDRGLNLLSNFDLFGHKYFY